MKKWFKLDQNNSGGWFAGNYNEIYIFANSKEEAQTILEKQDWYTDSFCECCGERWDDPEEVDAESLLYVPFPKTVNVAIVGEVAHEFSEGSSIFSNYGTKINALEYLRKYEVK
jgi:hypothetical protein